MTKQKYRAEQENSKVVLSCKPKHCLWERLDMKGKWNKYGKGRLSQYFLKSAPPSLKLPCYSHSLCSHGSQPSLWIPPRKWAIRTRTFWCDLQLGSSPKNHPAEPPWVGAVVELPILYIILESWGSWGWAGSNWPNALVMSGEGNGNPLQYSCLEKSTNKGAW